MESDLVKEVKEEEVEVEEVEEEGGGILLTQLSR